MTTTIHGCSVADCDRRHVARGLCSMHWQRLRRHGDPNVRLPSTGSPAVDPWSRIDSSGGPESCWPWTHTTDKDGYGLQKIHGRSWRVARWALTQAVGELRPDEVTRHTCDNPICCNPAHLIRGTVQDNASDMVERGRQNKGNAHWARRDSTAVRGENNASAHLTEAQVAAIRRRYAAGGSTQVSLADEYGVSQTTISAITRGASWRHSDMEMEAAA